ncbi:MAG: hypothetical protein CMP59_07535 [Flavobacteriales bacterium]|nr:hypothetical protein [Flavobacteriales bacterium]|tara:strand:- start:665 stop:1393 length:729 start_codon:yes stop_codon:yes gene_type:complete
MNDLNQHRESSLDRELRTETAVKSFMANVFTYMTGALAITGVFAFWFASSENLMSYLYNRETGATALGWIVTIAPLIFVFAMSMSFNRLSSFALLLLFIAFSSIMGISFSFIFLAYTASSITTTFFITAGTFGAMALVGYTTSTDLTKFGGILMMALIGLIIAMVVNWFVGSGTLDYVISCIGVLIFTGLTAYDVQKLKRIGIGEEYGAEGMNKLAIMGALSLYLDFINLFLFLLRLFGDRR